MKVAVSHLKNACRLCLGLCLLGGLLASGSDSPISDDAINIHVTGIEIVSGTYQDDSEAGEVETFFEVDLYTDASVQKVTLWKEGASDDEKAVIEASDEGNWLEWEDDDTGIGFEIGYEYDDDEAEWEFEAYSTDATAMASMFGMGTYWVEVTYSDGSTDLTSVWFGAYDETAKTAVVGTGLAAPAAAPELTFSPDGLVYNAGSTVTISWSATADPNTAGLFLYMENEIDHNQEVDTGALPADEAGSRNLNQDGVWVVETGYFNGYDESVGIVNGDAIPLVVAKIASREYGVTIGEYYTINGTITVDDSLTGTPRSGVFSDADMNDWVDCDIDVEPTGTDGEWTYEIGPLPAGTYYVNAFLDADDDYQWEEGDLDVSYGEAITLGPDATGKDFAFSVDGPEVSIDALLQSVSIGRYVGYGRPGMDDTTYNVEFEVTTAASVTAVTVTAPDSASHALTEWSLSDDGLYKEWFFETSSTESTLLSTTYTEGDYTLELVYDGGTASTVVPFADWDGVSTMPVLTAVPAIDSPSPLDGESLELGSITFDWSNVDANANHIGFDYEMAGSDEGTSLEFNGSDDNDGPLSTRSYTVSDFSAGDWVLCLSYGYGVVQSNADGVQYNVWTCNDTTYEFSVAAGAPISEDAINTHVTGIEIVSGTYQDDSDAGEVETFFEVEVYTDAAVQKVTLYKEGASDEEKAVIEASDEGNWSEWEDDDTGIGFEIGYEYDDDEAEWEFEAYSTDATAMASMFGMGTYWVEVTYSDGSTDLTSVWFGAYDETAKTAVVGTGLAAPAAAPELTFSPDGLVYNAGSTVTISWSATADPNTAGLFLYMENEIDHNQEVDTGALPADEAGSRNLNQDGVWVVETGYFNGYDESVGIVNGDAIPLVVAKIASREYGVTIGEYYTINGTITVDDSLTGTPRSGVFSDADMNDWVDCDIDVEPTGTDGEWTYEIGPLPAGTYYVNAFLDADDDYQWEEGDLDVSYGEAITLGPDATGKDFAFSVDGPEVSIDALLQSVSIGRYVGYGRPGMDDTTYNVEFEVTTAASVTAVTVTAPDSASHALTEWSLSDDGLYKEWFFETSSTESTLLSTTYTEGDYTLELVYDGGTASTVVPFADWDGVSTMPVLTAVPAIDSPSPLDGESLELGSITFDWSNVDANANHIGFDYEMAGSDEGTSLEFNGSDDNDGPLSTRSYTVSDFSAGDWVLCLSYGYGVVQSNADGVQYNVWYSNDSCYEFSIVDAVIPAIALDGESIAVDPAGWSNLEDDVDAYSYQWKCNGVIIDGAMDARLPLDQVDAGDTVTCVVMAQAGEMVGEPYETDPVAILELTAGWNLISLPVEPWETDPEHVLVDTATGKPSYVGAVWGWDAGRYEEAIGLEAGSGYWVFCLDAPAQPLLVSGVMCADTLETLQLGWNLLGPVGDPKFRYLDEAAVAYGWNGNDYLVPENNLLQKCLGYWIYSGEDGSDMDLQTETD
jgi:hypothetical protein